MKRMKTTSQNYTYSRSHRHLEIVALYAVAVQLVILLCTAVGEIHGWRDVLLGLIALPFGLCLADLLSGSTHWLADRYGDKNTPIFGPHFIGTFREHHFDQLAITRHDFIETNGDVAIVTSLGLPL